MPRTELRGAAFREYMEDCKRAKYINMVKMEKLNKKEQEVLKRKLRMKKENTD